MSAITIIKQNSQGEETWRYDGRILEYGEKQIVIEAFFDRDNMEFHGMRLRKGDRFVETYYFERWYNIFEIYDREDGRLKGWYCNISSPAAKTGCRLAYRDLALDLLVFPDGRQIVLDEDEFAALTLSPREQKMALLALAELQVYFKEKIRTAKAAAADQYNCDKHNNKSGISFRTIFLCRGDYGFKFLSHFSLLCNAQGTGVSIN